MPHSSDEGSQGARGAIRCLIIQLGSSERILQSLMALKAVKQLYSKVEIHFIVDQPNQDLLSRVPWIDGVTIIPREELMRSLRRGETRVSEAIPVLAQKLAPLVRVGWDYVINWTYSEASSFLGSLIPAVVKLGFSRRSDRSLECGDDWSMYVHAILQGSGYQNIHLTDILTTQLLTALQINHGDPNAHTSQGADSVAAKTFFKFVDTDASEIWSQRNLSKKWISVHIDKKLWDIEAWLRMLETVLARVPDVSIYLLGNELNDADHMKIRHWLRNELIADGRVLNLIAKNHFDIWAQAIGRSHWLISSDFTTEQLASVIGTRVLHLSDTHQVFFSSGPYGNGHYILTPSNATEKLKPTPLLSAKIFEYLYFEWSLKRGATCQEFVSKHAELTQEIQSFRVLRSRIRPTSEGGGVVYEAHTVSPMSLAEWSAVVMGQVARSWYCGWVAPLGQGIERDRISADLLKELRGLEGVIDEVSKECEKGASIASLLVQKAKRVRAAHIMDVKLKEEIRELGEQLASIDLRIEDAAQRNSALKSFSNLSKVMLHHLQGSYLEEVSRGAAQAYRQIREGLELTQQWVKHTLKVARPVSLEPRSERGLSL